jgi:hypothetical protein
MLEDQAHIRMPFPYPPQYVIAMGALGTDRDEFAQAVLALHQGEGRQGALVHKLCAAELANCGMHASSLFLFDLPLHTPQNLSS